MADYHEFTSPRTTEPDPTSLSEACTAFDPSIGITHAVGSGVWNMKKNTTWTAPQIAAAQQQLDTAPAASPQLTAQAQLKGMPIYDQAQIFALLDAINTVRGKLVPPLPPVTPGQAMQAMLDKALTLQPRPPTGGAREE
jgi:hypothetical protein